MIPPWKTIWIRIPCHAILVHSFLMMSVVVATLSRLVLRSYCSNPRPQKIVFLVTEHIHFTNCSGRSRIDRVSISPLLFADQLPCFNKFCKRPFNSFCRTRSLVDVYSLANSLLIGECEWCNDYKLLVESLNDQKISSYSASNWQRNTKWDKTSH